MTVSGYVRKWTERKQQRSTTIAKESPEDERIDTIAISFYTEGGVKIFDTDAGRKILGDMHSEQFQALYDVIIDKTGKLAYHESLVAQYRKVQATALEQVVAEAKVSESEAENTSGNESK